jgi:dipeptidyl aminopeptidase/acylaminoacyl peptidase
MKKQPLDLETLLRIPYVDPDRGFDLSPDGKSIAFAWNPAGRWEIYILPLDRSAPPEQITSGAGAKFAPRWSHDGSRLAYVLDLDGGENFDIYVCDLSTKIHTNLTPDTPDAIQPGFCWSPDDQWIAFASDRSGRFDTYVIPSTGGAARQVLNLPFPDWQAYWSPDGEWIAVVVEAHGQDFYTMITPASAEGKPFAITVGGKPICAKGAVWSPSGDRIAFSSNIHGSYNIGSFDLKTRQVTWLTQGEGDKEMPAWSPGGERLAYVHSQGPVTSLVVIDPKKGTSVSYQVDPGVHYKPHFTLEGGKLVFVFDNPRHPDDLWILDLKDGTSLPLTQSLPAGIDPADFVLPVEIQYTSLDGRSVPALLYQPVDREELPPAVVYVHGGPNWLTQVTWDSLVQHMLSRGWVILAPNYRGSTGYGRDWQLANRFDLGGGDTKDVVAGADYLVQSGKADPARIAVTGRSYGGYLTMTSLTQYPDRWAGGSAVVPFLNWFTAHENSRKDLQHWDLENFGSPENDRELFRERSPYFYLDRVTAPVQLICGAHDPRCPASESIQARDRLAAQGKTFDFILYPDEGHSFLKTENVVDARRRRADFLAGLFEVKGS